MTYRPAADFSSVPLNPICLSQRQFSWAVLLPRHWGVKSGLVRTKIRSCVLCLLHWDWGCRREAFKKPKPNIVRVCVQEVVFFACINNVGCLLGDNEARRVFRSHCWSARTWQLRKCRRWAPDYI